MPKDEKKKKKKRRYGGISFTFDDSDDKITPAERAWVSGPPNKTLSRAEQERRIRIIENSPVPLTQAEMDDPSRIEVFGQRGVDSEDEPEVERDWRGKPKNAEFYGKGKWEQIVKDTNLPTGQFPSDRDDRWNTIVGRLKDQRVPQNIGKLKPDQARTDALLRRDPNRSVAITDQVEGRLPNKKYTAPLGWLNQQSHSTQDKPVEMRFDRKENGEVNRRLVQVNKHDRTEGRHREQIEAENRANWDRRAKNIANQQKRDDADEASAWARGRNSARAYDPPITEEESRRRKRRLETISKPAKMQGKIISSESHPASRDYNELLKAKRKEEDERARPSLLRSKAEQARRERERDTARSRRADSLGKHPSSMSSAHPRERDAERGMNEEQKKIHRAGYKHQFGASEFQNEYPKEHPVRNFRMQVARKPRETDQEFDRRVSLLDEQRRRYYGADENGMVDTPSGKYSLKDIIAERNKTSLTQGDGPLYSMMRGVSAQNRLAGNPEMYKGATKEDSSKALSDLEMARMAEAETMGLRNFAQGSNQKADPAHLNLYRDVDRDGASDARIVTPYTLDDNGINHSEADALHGFMAKKDGSTLLSYDTDDRGYETPVKERIIHSGIQRGSDEQDQQRPSLFQRIKNIFRTPNAGQSVDPEEEVIRQQDEMFRRPSPLQRARNFIQRLGRGRGREEESEGLYPDFDAWEDDNKDAFGDSFDEDDARGNGRSAPVFHPPDDYYDVIGGAGGPARRPSLFERAGNAMRGAGQRAGDAMRGAGQRIGNAMRGAGQGMQDVLSRMRNRNPAQQQPQQPHRPPTHDMQYRVPAPTFNMELGRYEDAPGSSGMTNFEDPPNGDRPPLFGQPQTQPQYSDEESYAELGQESWRELLARLSVEDGGNQ